jgi:hypothetical protein
MPDALGSTLPELLDALGRAVGLQSVKAIVMTQACDIEHAHVRNVILCPVYALVEEYKVSWEQRQRDREQPTNAKTWKKHTTEIKDGKIWNRTMLRRHDAPEGSVLSAPTQIVDFHEVFSVPLDFLSAWVRSSGSPRLRLLPPYREHLSQSFARFFMRVGLPEEVDP